MSGKYKKSIIWAVIYILGLIKVGFIFSFYSDSGFCGRRPGRLDRSVKAFVDFIGSSPARKNKRFCFSLAYSKNSLTGGTPHFVRQTPPVGRSENLTGPSFTAPMVFRHKTLHLSLALPGKENIRKFLQLNSGAAYRSGNIGLLI